MDNQQRVVELLTEQNELLKRHLVRLKFSLMSLLLLTTVTCCGLGFLMWLQYHPRIYPILPPTASGANTLYGNIQPAPTATFELAPVAPAPPSESPGYTSPTAPAQAPVFDR
jgi:hypothetical protein